LTRAAVLPDSRYWKRFFGGRDERNVFRRCPTPTTTAAARCTPFKDSPIAIQPMTTARYRHLPPKASIGPVDRHFPLLRYVEVPGAQTNLWRDYKKEWINKKA
jgi:hypothetical protein